MGSKREAVRLASVGVAVPPLSLTQAEGAAVLRKRFAGRLTSRSMDTIEKVFAHPSIARRHFALAHPEEVIDEDPDRRIARFTTWAVDLAAEAARHALADVGLTSADVAALVVNTCTGYICPGLSTYLIERLGLARHVRAFDLVGAGCGGALPNLQLCQALAAEAEGGVVLSIAVEICTATFQMSDNLSLIISNALFGDGAAAAVVWTRPAGLTLAASACRFAPEFREDIRYVHKGGQLHNQLSLALPKRLRGPVAEVVAALLEPRELRVSDVHNWAVHPGGEKVLAALEEELGLSESQLAPAREILRDYGNMSSPTAWFVLRRLLDCGMASGEWCVVLAFGAGLSAHGALLRQE